MSETTFEFSGDERMEQPIAAALRRVIDPEMAMDILALGLVYGVEATPGHVRLRITMTSAACPVTELIVDEARHELAQALGEATQVEVDVVWDPPWTPERMSPAARAAMGWD
jgi:metal-sulfur cluster biosynthetic enzyme